MQMDVATRACVKRMPSDGQRVEPRRADDPVAGRADRIPSCVVDDEHDDVRPGSEGLRLVGVSQRTCRGAGQDQSGEQPGHRHEL